jgi:quercetin dioxygenase-like cupin family protein
MRFLSKLLLSGLVAVPLGAARAQSAMSSAPSVTFFDSNAVAAAFAKGKPLLEGAAYKIHASRRETPGQAEVHTRDTDIVYVLQGHAVFITGGTAKDLRTVAPDELRGPGIEGGETHHLRAGVVIVVPSGTPHWFKSIDGPFLYYVVKVTKGGM